MADEKKPPQGAVLTDGACFYKKTKYTQALCRVGLEHHAAVMAGHNAGMHDSPVFAALCKSRDAFDALLATLDPTLLLKDEKPVIDGGCGMAAHNGR